MAVKEVGKFGRFWEMNQGGPHAKNRKEIFKCTGCGGETHHEKGFNGEPDVGNCAHGCASRSDWSPGNVSSLYSNNYDTIFRKASI